MRQETKETKEFLINSGQNLRGIRTMKGYTIEQLAERASIPVETLQGVEDGVIDIDILCLADTARNGAKRPIAVSRSILRNNIACAVRTQSVESF